MRHRVSTISRLQVPIAPNRIQINRTIAGGEIQQRPVRRAGNRSWRCRRIDGGLGNVADLTG